MATATATATATAAARQVAKWHRAVISNDGDRARFNTIFENGEAGEYEWSKTLLSRHEEGLTVEEFLAKYPVGAAFKYENLSPRAFSNVGKRIVRRDFDGYKQNKTLIWFDDNTSSDAWNISVVAASGKVTEPFGQLVYFDGNDGVGFQFVPNSTKAIHPEILVGVLAHIAVVNRNSI